MSEQVKPASDEERLQLPDLIDLLDEQADYAWIADQAKVRLVTVALAVKELRELPARIEQQSRQGERPDVEGVWGWYNIGPIRAVCDYALALEAANAELTAERDEWAAEYTKMKDLFCKAEEARAAACRARDSWQQEAEANEQEITELTKKVEKGRGWCQKHMGKEADCHSIAHDSYCWHFGRCPWTALKASKALDTMGPDKESVPASANSGDMAQRR